MLDESPRSLSDREMEVLRQLATGASNQQIAYDLDISVNTVKVHIRNIFEKLGVSSRTEATLYAIQSGWVQVGGEATGDRAPGNSLSLAAGQEGLFRLRRVNWRALILAGVALVTILAVVTWYFAAAPGAASGVPSTRSPATGPPAVRVRTLTPMPDARAGLASVVHDFQVYTIGGETANGLTGAVDRYDPRADRWFPQASKPTPVRGAGAAVARGKIYVPGGCTAANRALSILEIYDPAGDHWSVGPDLPAPVCEYAIAALEGQIYVLGGRDGTEYKADVFAFDPRENRWAKLAPMPTARASAAAAVSGGRIFVVGGTNGTDLVTNEVFAPGKEGSAAWEKGAPLPQGRAGLGLVTIGNTLYAVGGESQGQHQSVAQYDVTTDTWTQVSLDGASFPRHAGVVELDASKILVLGGWLEWPLAATTEYTLRYQIFLP